MKLDKVEAGRHVQKIYSRVWIVIITVTIFTLGGFFGYISVQKSRTIIPDAIKSKINFTIFWPDKTKFIIPDKQTVKYDPKNKLLTYLAKTDEGIQLTVSEQQTPETFTDIPQVYDKFIENLQQYSTFESVSGKIFLTRPKESKLGQTAVMNSKGTLMFVRPSKDLSDDSWRQFFNDLEVIR